MGAVSLGVTMLILGAVFLLLFYTAINRERPHIVLPDGDASIDISASGGNATGENSVSRVEVTAENVQSVIALLDRPETYMQNILLTTFWSGGEGQTMVNTAVDGSLIRIDTVLPGGQMRHIIQNETKSYLWYNHEHTVCTMERGSFSQDEEQWIPTYEDLLRIDQKCIVQAGYEPYQDIDCIYAATGKDAIGYEERYWISVDSGLLIAAERLQNGVPVYRVEAQELSLEEPGAEMFTLPNGTVLS